MTQLTFKGLYLIIGSGLSPDEADIWLLPDISFVQYRNKSANQTTQKKEAVKLCTLCRERNIGFIINDNIDLAAAVCADGVHLGKHDASITQARHALGENAVIGASCYNSFERALTAQRKGANYVAFGSLFPSHTKPKAVNITLENLTQYQQRLSLPVCAIGGITTENLACVLDTGVSMAAVNAGIANAPNPMTAIKTYLEIFSRHM